MADDSQAEITRKQRRSKAFDLHCFGANWTRIGEELGISQKQARLDVERYASEIGKESNEQRRKVYSRMLMDDILTENQAIAALRPYALAREVNTVPDFEASRTLAQHMRTKQKLVAELCLINGVRMPVVTKVEHTGAAGGPIEMSIDDILKSVTVGRENEDAVDHTEDSDTKH